VEFIPSSAAGPEAQALSTSSIRLSSKLDTPLVLVVSLLAPRDPHAERINFFQSAEQDSQIYGSRVKAGRARNEVTKGVELTRKTIERIIFGT
jgi:hypothetical protein